MSDGPLLFVYGTLRPGHQGAGAPMMRALAARSRHVGAATARGRLYAIDWFPGMTESADIGDRVTGDVLRLSADDGLLAELDAYEGPDYARREIAVKLADGDDIRSWTYVWIGALDGATAIPDGDFFSLAPVAS